MTAKTYLGDGVYVALRDGRLVLTTENGLAVTNTIVLEPEVYQSLVDYVATLAASADTPATPQP